MKYFTLLLLATVFAFSCGDAATAMEDTAAGAADAVAETTEAAAGAVIDAVDTAADTAVDAMTPEKSMLQSTIEAVTSVGGDITALPAGAAVSNIEGWITKLSSMEGTEGIVTELTSLKTELSSGKIDGGKVSGILSTLAEQTKGLAGDNKMLATVAGALQAGADKLGGK
jgi:hypothetical protein